MSIAEDKKIRNSNKNKFLSPVPMTDEQMSAQKYMSLYSIRDIKNV